MKTKLTFLGTVLILAFLGCKKDLSEDITQYHWKLKSQTVTPAMTLNGKTSTNYLSLQNSDGCTKDNKLSLNTDGVFSISSTGALCDMVANNSTQKWVRTDNKLLLKYGTSFEEEFEIEKDRMTSTSTIVIGDKSYLLVTVRKAEKKK